MESIQSDRMPLSVQPPQRIDTTASLNSANSKSNAENMNNNKSSNISDISLAYKRKSVKHRIECSVSVSVTSSDISELAMSLGDRQCSMYKNGYNSSIASCVVCDEQIVNGLFAVETVLFIPNKNDPAYENLGRFRIELPRVACYECSQEYANDNNTQIIKTQPISLCNVWKNYKNGSLNALINSNTNAAAAAANAAMANMNVNTNVNVNVNASQSQTETDKINVAECDEKVDNNNKNNTNDNDNVQQQMNNEMNNNNSNNACNKTVMPLTEAERDPFDDGFLICTQLVKTGGADQGGLQVGDVFVEFGHYSKARFPGLKSIANLVRRSAGKEINVVVWRKLEQMNGIEDDGTGRTVFQKLALKLKPLQSHDADGGGVLGAVINTYPLPEMKN